MKVSTVVRSCLVGCLLIYLGLRYTSYAAAQEGIRLTINQVDDEGFPSVKAYFTVTDASGLPIEQLQPSMFTVSEDRQSVQDFKTTEIDNSDQPITVVLAIDTSESIATGTSTSLTDTKAAAVAFVESLATQDKVGLVTFSDTATEVTSLTADHVSVIAAINGLAPQGATAMYDAIVTSVAMLKDLPPGRKAIVLVADGADTSSSFTFDNAINEAARWSIPVYPIGFGAIDENAIMKIATLTGGYAQITPSTSELQRAFDSVLQTLRKQYLLEFVSQFPADGTEHTLIINLTYEGVQINNDYLFTAQPGEITVTLRGLGDNQAVGGAIKFSPEIIAPGPTASVEYRLDEEILTTMLESPFEYTWDSTAIPEGQHVLKVTVTDIAGNMGIQELRLFVRPPIKVTWTSPAGNAQLSNRSQTLDVNVDSLAGVANVELYVDDQLIQAFTAPPYQLDWSLAGLSPGEHTLKAVVTDVNNTSAEESIPVTISMMNSTLILAFAVAVAVAVAALVIPIAMRRRRQFSVAPAPSSGGTALMVLHELNGRNPGQIWSIGKSDVHIGRKADANDIPVTGTSASRQHAIIRWEGGRHVLYSLKPDNPTLINGQPIEHQHMLSPGDLIQIGDSSFRFEAQQ